MKESPPQTPHEGELELEVAAGVDALRRHPALRGTGEPRASQARRGFPQPSGDPRKARPIETAPGTDVETLLEVIVADCLAQISDNQLPAREGIDPEGVHQLRVGTRRLRSALGLLRSVLPADAVTRFRAELRWLAGELGDARDLDVFLTESLEAPLRLRPDDGALKRLRDEANLAREEAGARVRRVLDHPRTARLLRELGAWLAGRGWREQALTPQSAALFGPARPVLAGFLDERQRRVRRAGRGLRHKKRGELHALRIELKKLRYVSEFARPLFPGKRARRYTRRVAALQDRLGHLNDVAVAERLLGALFRRLQGEAGPELQRAGGFVLGCSAAKDEEARVGLARAWRRFTRTTPFWQ